MWQQTFTNLGATGRHNDSGEGETAVGDPAIKGPFILLSRKEIIMKKLFAMFGIVVLTAGLSACNTFRGMGQDVEAGGEKLQGASKEVQSDMKKN